MRAFILIVVVIVIVVGIWFRLTRLTESPPGFYVDEASIAENAYQILIRGRDEWGVPYPIYFKAFGEYKNPVFIYSLVPMYRLFGVSLETVRLTAAFWGLAAVAATGLAVFLVTRHSGLTVLAIIFSLFLPWHFHSSRIAFEAVTLPFFLAAALASLIQYWHSFQSRWLFLSTGLAGLTFYTYTSARIFAPLLFIFICLSAFKKHAKHIPALMLTFFLCLLPALIWNYYYPDSLFSRYRQTATRDFRQFVTTYLHQFDPKLWLLSGDTNLRHSPGKGLLPLALAPLFFYSLFLHLKSWRQPLSLFVLSAVITAPAAAALTQTDPNALRMIHLVPVLILVVVTGLQALVNHKSRFSKILLACLLIAGIYEHIRFFQSYYRDFPAQASWWFDTPFIRSYPYLSTLKQPVWIHSYLLAGGHYITASFLCHAGLGCPDTPLNFSGNDSASTPETLNVYFDNEQLRLIP